MSEKIEFEAEVTEARRKEWGASRHTGGEIVLSVGREVQPERCLELGRYRVILEPVEELKLCPFCGSEAAALRDPARHGWVVGCESGLTCAAFGPVASTKADAIAAWNQRESDGHVAELESLCRDCIHYIKNHLGAGRKGFALVKRLIGAVEE